MLRKSSQETKPMDRVNFKIVRQFWTIAQTYWNGDQKWQARGMLLGVVLFLLAYTGLSVVLNNKRGVLISALSAQDQPRFWQTVTIFLGVLILYAPLLAGYRYLRDRLSLQWRRWLTHQFVDRYFGGRAFYALNFADETIDNPDQRIAEDIRSFTQESLTFLLAVVESVLAVVAFSSVLWGISHLLVVFLVVYALVGTLATTLIFGRPLVRLNFEQLKKEADLRFSLVRARENAEAIAFYRGEEQESFQVKQRFLEVFENVQRLLIWELNLNILTNAYEFIPFILPALVVAPGIFAGEVEVGKVSEAQGAFVRVFFSLNLVVARFQELTTFGAGVGRLFALAEFLEQAGTSAENAASPESSAANPPQPTIATVEADRLALEAVTLETPNHQRVLVTGLAVEIPSGEGLLVMGPSGCGKSSLLRAMAGLWNSGSGTIVRPPLSQVLFLPQRPYMVLGTLRDQMLYPHTRTGIDSATDSSATDSGLEVEDARLKQILAQVNLADLDDRLGGFDAEQDWGNVLSLGEQQRLTFARLLLQKPNYAILDEATSALDLDNEARLYHHLKAIGTTFLSVGHRATLAHYHQRILEFQPDGSYKILPGLEPG
jgi:vitamin B12/bleomycin/antimicrobial peptide transport system ATP-binding/permease protein